MPSSSSEYSQGISRPLASFRVLGFHVSPAQRDIKAGSIPRAGGAEKFRQQATDIRERVGDLGDVAASSFYVAYNPLVDQIKALTDAMRLNLGIAAMPKVNGGHRHNRRD